MLTVPPPTRGQRQTTTTATRPQRSPPSSPSAIRAHQLLEQQRQRQQQLRRPVAGRKTFTGCWTCRARKRKCDEAVPHCHQCTKKNLVCGGYSARLQWLPCDGPGVAGGVTGGGPGGGGGGSGPTAVRTVSSQRRQISFSIPSAVLADAELDKLLLALDEDTPALDRTTLRGPFGVFAAARTPPVLPPSMPGPVVHAPSDTGLYDPDLFSTSMAFAHVLDQQQQQQQQQQQIPRHMQHPHVFPALPAVAPGDLDVFGGGPANTGDSASVPMAWEMDDMWAGLTLGSMLLQQQSQNQSQSQHQQPPSPSTSNSFPQLSLFDLLEHHSGMNGMVVEPQGQTEGSVVEEEEEDDTMEDIMDVPPTTPGSVEQLPSSSSSPSSPSAQSSSSLTIRLPTLPPPERPLTPAAFLLQPKMRFLLSHYMQHVVNSFCVSTRTTRSPWKSIHLPRALQGSGELAVMGATSHARSALLNALLAVSAYCLANQYDLAGCRRQRPDAPEAARWRKVGSQLRLRVLSSLRRGLAEATSDGGAASEGGGEHPGRGLLTYANAYSSYDTYAPSPSTPSSPPSPPSPSSLVLTARPKYKELLAAMLSMVSVDVASGDTATTHTHLLGCESLIRSAQAWKRHYSAKARSLHRIYYYLRVIYASTNLVDTFDEDGDSREDETTGAPPPKGTRAWLEETLLESSEHAASCEFIYGVPAALLILLARVTDHVRRLGGGPDGGNSGSSGSSGSRRSSLSDSAAHLAAESDRLEAEVLTFPVDQLVAQGDGSSGTTTTTTTAEDRAIQQHQTRAFHQALVLYFCQNVRAMHALHLRPYVEAVLRHAEAVEAIKRRSGVASGTLYWPCFVAASEAVDPALQQRFLRWYETTYCAGFAGCLRGRDIAAEVWRRRRAGWPRERSTWRAVVASENACLMLT